MAVTEDDVRKLASLARIELSDEAIMKLRSEIEAILGYVAVIQSVPLLEGGSASPHMHLENVMREDGVPHEPGMFTEKILAQAPHRDGAFIRVKKILGE